MYEVGSVIEFKPDRFAVLTFAINDETANPWRKNQEVALGWGVVVTARDGWVMDTRIEPMVMCNSCSAMVPLVTHQHLIHELTIAWSMPV